MQMTEPLTPPGGPEGGVRTLVPRWVEGASPAPGRAAEHVEPLPAGLAAGVDRLAGDLAVASTAVLLAVHGRVLTELTGQPEVETAWVPPGGTAPGPRPDRHRAPSCRWA